jgi:BirA family biotin operon repressor/biotin-[acetyl-CoA-carboxylase] ligase
VLVRGRKIAGVLVEPRLDGGKIEFAVVGFGINVGHRVSDFPEELQKSATSMKRERIEVPCDDVVKAVIASLDRWYRAEREALNDAWSRHGGSERLPEIL